MMELCSFKKYALKIFVKKLANQVAFVFKKFSNEFV